MQRKHITTACQICRDSKTKCDGVRPTCGSCKRKGKLCEYSGKDDKRKLSLRTAVEMLFARVEQLTLLTNKHNINAPPFSADEQALLEQVCVTLELPVDRILPSIEEQLVPMPAQALQSPPNTDTFSEVIATSENSIALSTVQPTSVFDMSWNPNSGTDVDMQNWTELFASDTWDGSPSDWPWQVLNDFPSLPAPVNDPASAVLQHGNILQNEEPRSDSSSDDEVEGDIIPSLAARFGSLRVAADGQLRFYGTASNYHFLTGFRHNDLKIDNDEMHHAARAALEHAQLDQEPPSSLLNHLLEQFFVWHNPSHLTVDRNMFETARAKSTDGRRAYCSPSLINAMCAIGAAYEGRYHQSFITFPKPLADFFAERSKLFLEFEFDSPCVSTVQALLLLSSHEAAAGRDGRMWLYSGMAMRLSFDVGLHVDSGPYVKQGLLTAQEAESRHSTFWSCVVVNQLWSFSLGRPFRVDSEEITVARPTLTVVDSVSAGWTNAMSDADALTLISNAAVGQHSISLIPAQWISLCEELAPLVRVLYGCVKISKATLQALSHKITTRLEKWHETLPDVLNIQPGSTPTSQVLLLHMAYHNFCILIHRPWTSKGSQPDGRLGPGHSHARGVCRKSASEIASLLRIYELHYGFRKMNVYVVNIIFSASLILIFGLIAEEISDGHQDQDAKGDVTKDLNACFRALDELGRSFESAKRSHEHLLAIQKRWSQRKRDAKAGTKRRGRRQNSSTGSTQKRNRPS